MSPAVGTPLLESLPAFLSGDVGVYVFAADGSLIESFGVVADVARFDDLGDCQSAVVRKALDGSRVVVTMATVQPDSAGQPDSKVSFVAALVDSIIEREQLECDLESMSASSLSLLEEVAMVGDVMVELSTGEDDAQVVARGLASIVVAASVEQAVYLRHNPARDMFEVVVQVSIDDEHRRAVITPYTADSLVPASEGVVGRAVRSMGSPLLESVPPSGRLGAEGSPENLAQHEVLAVPVTYGPQGQEKLIGVVMLFDKRATSYSTVTEFGSHETKMASALASMLGAVLGARMSAELGKEIKMATTIQQQILPDRPAKVAGFDLAGRCDTSGAVGGDYFDFLPMADDRTLAVVADVSGHNLASGMVMVSARATLRLLASKGADPVEIFDDLAAAMFTDLSQTERFITAAGCTIAPEQPEIEIVNAGHNDTMVFRHGSGVVERLPSEDTILGFLPGVNYERQTIGLEPGDVVVLYTDGITEAVNAYGEMFEEERLVSVLQRSCSGSAQEILDAIYGAVESFADEASGGDDITAVVVKYHGTSEAEAR